MCTTRVTIADSPNLAPASFLLNCARQLAGNIVGHPVHAAAFADDVVGAQNLRHAVEAAVAGSHAVRT